MKSFAVVASLIVILGQGSSLWAAGSPEPSKYEGWESYYSAHRQELNGYMNITPGDVANVLPRFLNGGFILASSHGPQWITTGGVLTTAITGWFPTPNLYSLNYLGFHITNWSDNFYVYTDPNRNPLYGNEYSLYTREEWKQYGEYYCREHDPGYCEQQVWDTKTTNTEETHRRRREWNFHLAPEIFFDGDWTRKLVQLDDATDKRTQLALPAELEGTGKPTLLEVKDSSQQGYRLSRITNFTLGVGVAGTWRYDYAVGARRYFGTYVGLLPVVGKSVQNDYVVQTPDEAQNLPNRGFPFQAADLVSWKIGESARYSTTGGVVFNAGVAFGTVSVGPAWLASGEWETLIEKIDQDRVYVKLTKTDLQALSLAVSVAPASLAVTEFREADRSFSYMLHLARPDAAAAYEELMHGNLIPVQNLAREAKSNGVIAVTTEIGRMRGRLRSFRVGLPWIANLSNSEGRLHRVSDTEFHPDASRSTIEYGIYLKNNESRFLANVSSEGKVFYGAVYETVNAKGAKETGFFGEFLWNYENTHARLHDVREALDDLASDTGLRNEVAVQFSAALQPFDQLGYVKLGLKAHLNSVASETLMKLAADPATASVFETVAEGFARDYFQAGDFNGICVYPNESLKACAYRLTNEARQGAWRMAMALQAMQASRGDSGAFADAYGRFGQAMLTNQFTFQTALNLVKGRGASLAFQLEGEKMPQLTKALQWVPMAVGRK